jgi:hypothetical protein
VGELIDLIDKPQLLPGRLAKIRQLSGSCACNWPEYQAGTSSYSQPAAKLTGSLPLSQPSADFPRLTQGKIL